jgi:hypothetical protein
MSANISGHILWLPQHLRSRFFLKSRGARLNLDLITMHTPSLPYGSMNSLNAKADGRRIIMFGFGGFGFGLRRLLIFLLVIATIFVFAGVGFGF